MFAIYEMCPRVFGVLVFPEALHPVIFESPRVMYFVTAGTSWTIWYCRWVGLRSGGHGLSSARVLLVGAML